jgi:hypothetical protein
VKAKKALFFLFIGSVALTQAQGDKSAFGKEPNSQLKELYAQPYNKKTEIKLDGKKYRIYNNYVTLGIGKGYNSIWNSGFITTGADFNFHIQKTYFQMGGYVQGPSFYNKQQVQLHGAAGYRKESYKYFWAAFGGLSYSNGFYPFMLKDAKGEDSVTTYPIMSQVGVYTAVQFFYKLKFDYGIGLTLFGDINSKQYFVGARVELFFSGAYRGTILHKDEE